LDRPLGIYASSVSRRDLHRRRARCRRSTLAARMGNWVAVVALVALVALAVMVVERVA
jgi:hypothetical protein